MQKDAVLANNEKVFLEEKLALPIRELFRQVAGIMKHLIGLVVPALALFVWETAARLHWIKPVFLPAPATVAATFHDMLVNGEFLLDFQVSILTVAHGFLWGTGLGLFCGTAAGLSRTTERLFGPFLNGIRQVPPIAWLPLIVLWVGIGDAGKLVVIAKSVFFPVFLNTLQGIRNVSREYVEVARVYQFSRMQLIRRVIFPAALPTIFVGIRFGAGIAWAMIVAAEMLSGRKGLGFLLLQAQDLLMTDQVFVVIMIIGLVGCLIDALLRALERRMLRWKRNFNG